MKASELRLGNLFIEEHSDKIIEVIGLEKIKITFSGLFLDKWQAKPIPLTEEWLLKFGFEKENSLYVIDKDKYHTFSILVGGISFPFIKSNDKAIRENFSFYGIKYVHQLQNLYFALTGEELIINN